MSIPNGSGFGNYLPGISCSGPWCEVSSNIYVPDQASQNLQQLYLTTTHNGKPVGSHFVTGYFGRVSCGAARNCHALLENISLVGSSGGAFLARVSRGKVGKPDPIDPTLVGLACRGESCIAAGANRIVTFGGGRQTSLRSVAGVRDYLGVTFGPGTGAFFAAVGAAAHGSSVLTTG